MVIQSFYIIAWRGGQHIYSRTWVESTANPVLLSGLLASLEIMALNLTSEYVNVITLKNSRFFFLIDEPNRLLFVFITDLTEESPRFRDYLELLNKRFVEMFDPSSKNSLSYPPLLDGYAREVYTQVVDNLVANWEKGETSLLDARIMDVLDVFTLFFNAALQRFLDKATRKQHWGRLQDIFQDNTLTDHPFHHLAVSKEGVVDYIALNPNELEYNRMLSALTTTLRNLVLLLQEIHTKESYQNLFFKYFVPLIRSEVDRLKAYQLAEALVIELL